MDLSIVTGTYNRLAHLRAMVQSVRDSIAGIYGLSYEIVAVDGGSTDGTIEWCRQQPDIVLLEHGELRGAVKAFNDGAFAASGKYVIMANDDIEFVGNSVLLAYVYMETHPRAGGGCFYQNRNNRDWHVESMPAVQIIGPRQGKQVHVPYAQVGIFHKWLGDLVSWWCDENEFAPVPLGYLTKNDIKELAGRPMLHTYGGDNELSAQIWNRGYTIDPVPGAKIADREADDDLRRVNNIEGGKDPKSVRGHHPDSWMWGRKWWRKNQRLGYPNLAGPIIKDRPEVTNPMPVQSKERVLYLPIFEQGYPVQKAQKRGLRDALSEVALVYEFDYMERHVAIGKAKMLDELIRIANDFKPTVFLSQLHNPDMINGQDIDNLKHVCGSACRFVNWNGDYWPEQQLTNEALRLARSFHLMTLVNRDIVEKYQEVGINAHYWQIGWEPLGRGQEPEVFHDVVFLASGYSTARQRLGQILSKQDFSFGLYGNGWPTGLSRGENLYNFVEACKVYRGAKIAIGDSQWPKSGFVSNRIFQILAAGNCALFHQWFRDYEHLGLIDGDNCIIWDDQADLIGKIKYWLSPVNDAKLAAIAAAGEDLAVKRHSFEARVGELWQRLGIEKKQEVESWRW